ncbi:hypothetical protein FB451DRAFT_1477498 [Mycena latifolia]|nr:hypothetical protein FB451DRAFT_1477498 [Mycena latifolia]
MTSYRFPRHVVCTIYQARRSLSHPKLKVFQSRKARDSTFSGAYDDYLQAGTPSVARDSVRKSPSNSFIKRLKLLYNTDEYNRRLHPSHVHFLRIAGSARTASGNAMVVVALTRDGEIRSRRERQRRRKHDRQAHRPPTDPNFQYQPASHSTNRTYLLNTPVKIALEVRFDDIWFKRVKTRVLDDSVIQVHEALDLSVVVNSTIWGSTPSTFKWLECVDWSDHEDPETRFPLLIPRTYQRESASPLASPSDLEESRTFLHYSKSSRPLRIPTGVALLAPVHEIPDPPPLRTGKRKGAANTADEPRLKRVKRVPSDDLETPEMEKEEEGKSKQRAKPKPTFQGPRRSTRLAKPQVDVQLLTWPVNLDNSKKRAPKLNKSSKQVDSVVGHS